MLLLALSTLVVLALAVIRMLWKYRGNILDMYANCDLVARDAIAGGDIVTLNRRIVRYTILFTVAISTQR